MARLDGKVVLISGGGADGPPAPGETVAIGNGRATSILCAREGASVMVTDRSLALARETVDLIAGEGGVAEAMEADVLSEAEAAGLRWRRQCGDSVGFNCWSTTSGSWWAAVCSPPPPSNST